jgi:hypothetical protein
MSLAANISKVNDETIANIPNLIKLAEATAPPGTSGAAKLTAVLTAIGTSPTVVNSSNPSVQATSAAVSIAVLFANIFGVFKKSK